MSATPCGGFAEINNVTDLTEGLLNSTTLLHKPSVKSVSGLNTADLPPRIAIPGGMSAEFKAVIDLTKGLRRSTMRLRLIDLIDMASPD